MIPDPITDADIFNPETRELIIACVSIWGQLELVQKGSLGIKPIHLKRKRFIKNGKLR